MRSKSFSHTLRDETTVAKIENRNDLVLSVLYDLFVLIFQILYCIKKQCEKFVSYLQIN